MNPVARQRRTLHKPFRRRHRSTDSLSQHRQPRAT